jgi:cyanamide hydratase family protein with HD domain
MHIHIRLIRQNVLCYCYPVFRIFTLDLTLCFDLCADLDLFAFLDNTGAYADLVHADTIKDVCAHFPRMRWSRCFAATVQSEIELKPWAHSTALGEEFSEKVLGNSLMDPYE